MGLYELADWWDKQKQESEELLGDWVQENPQWWAIGIATLASTSMQLGAGMVDALRLGQGVAEGGVGGYVKDGARLLVFVGPLARIGGIVGRFVHTGRLRLATQIKGVTHPCTFTAVNNALTIISGRANNVFLTAREAAAATGQPFSALMMQGGHFIAAWIDELVPFLTKLGVRTRSLGTPQSIDDVVRAAQANDGVVVFAIEWTDIFGELHRHTMIAVRTLSGVRFADYGGKFVGRLADLARRGGIWLNKTPFTVAREPGFDGMRLFEGMKVVGALERYASTVWKGGMLLLQGVHAVETVEHGVDIAFPVSAAASIEPEAHEPDVIKASFEAFKARKQGSPVPKLRPVAFKGRRNGPPPGDRLTGVQYRLNALGFGAGAVDGIVGPRTKQAVTAFQGSYGLNPDGVPGPKTQSKLSEVCGY